MKDQKLQHIKFFGSQVYFSACNVDASRLAVHRKISCLDHFALCLLCSLFLGTAHDCFDTCFDFQNVKWLGDIVICSILQTKDLIHIITFCSQHDNRNTGSFTQLLADFKAVKLRKHHIKKYNIILFFSCHTQSFFAVICTVNFHAVLFQTEADSFYDQFLIIYN